MKREETPMNRIWIVGILAVFAITAFMSREAISEQKDGQRLESAKLDHGKKVYKNACAACHGQTGNGRGPVATHLLTKPRDFTSGIFKFRSTPSGSMPTDEDLARSITRGLHRTAMPPFRDMKNEDVQAVIVFLKDCVRRGLWTKFQKYVNDGEMTQKEAEEIIEERLMPDKPIEISLEPMMSDASMKRGKTVYQKMDCAKCHGEYGRGDGPSAEAFKDSWGYPVRTADFTLPNGVKGGDRAQDFYRTFMTGLDGTPMPSFESSLKPEEAWDLAHYVLSLRKGGW